MIKLLLCLVLAAYPSFAAFNFSRTVTVDHTKVSAAQVNFPVLVSISDASLKDAAHGGHVQSSSGFDINFFSDLSHTTALSWEVEKYDNVNGVLVAWVRIPSLSSTVDTTFYMFYGDATITTSQSTASAVWDANSKGVYHLSNGTTINILDSTGGSNLTNSNGVTAGSGKIDGGGSFASAGLQSLYIDAPAFPTGALASTFEVWFNMADNTAAYQVIGGWGGGSTSQREEIYWNKASSTFSLDFSSTGATFGWTWDADWHQIVLVTDGTGVIANIKVYFDGVSQTLSSTAGTIALLNTRFQLGQEPNVTPGTGSNYLHGVLDEVRVSNMARSSSWITTDYGNQSNPGNIGSAGFLRYGSEPSSACAITTASLPNGGVATAYSQTIASSLCTSASWSVSVGLLPAGLSLNSSTGAITGTPTTTGTSSFTIAVSSTNGSYSKAFSITIATLPTITNLAASANSPNSILLVWTTSAKTSSQASCGNVSGGPYSYASPTVDPVKSGGNDYYGVSAHSLAVVVPATNTSSTAYYCRVVSVDSFGNSVNSLEVSSGTTPALPNQPFTVITAPQGWIPYNDQQTGRNGSPNTGKGYRSDSYFCAWAADGNNYCSLNDGWGTTSNAGSTWSGAGSLIATGVVQATANGMTFSMRGNTTGVNSTGALGDINKPTTYTADGMRPYAESIQCARGVCIAPLQRGGPNSCTALVLTRDYFATTIAPQANTGPSVTGLPFTGPGLGTYGHPTVRSECSSTSYLQYRQFGFAQDWGGRPPQVGSPGYQFPVTHQVGTDAWIYHFAYTNGIENWTLMRTPLNNAAVTEAGQTLVQVYHGSGRGADGLLDSNWSTIGPGGLGVDTAYTDFPQYPYGRRGTFSWIGGAINRWVFLAYTPTPAYNGSAGSADGSGGILIWDVGPYPWAVLDATLVGFLLADPVNNPTFVPVFPQILESTCQYPADGSVTCMVSVTGSFLNAGTDEYAPYYRWVRFVPRDQTVSLPRTSWFGTKTTHIANGLDVLWLMDMPPWSTTITDHAGPRARKPNGYQITGIAAQLVVNDGRGLATGWAQSGGLTNPTTVTITTPYNVALTDFTALLTFMHDPHQAAVVNETPLDKTDFQVIRNTPTANSWRVKVGVTTSSAFSLATDGAFATLVVRRVGSQVTVYGSAGIGSNLPLTALTTFNDGTELGANTLTIGSLAGGAQPFYGTIGQLAIWSRGMSNPELITEMGAVRSDMASRTPTVVIP